ARFDGAFGALIGAAVAGERMRDVVMRDGQPAGAKALVPALLLKHAQDTGAPNPAAGAAPGAMVMAAEGASGGRLFPPHADRHSSETVIRADDLRIPPPGWGRVLVDGIQAARVSSTHQ